MMKKSFVVFVSLFALIFLDSDAIATRYRPGVAVAPAADPTAPAPAKRSTKYRRGVPVAPATPAAPAQGKPSTKYRRGVAVPPATLAAPEIDNPAPPTSASRKRQRETEDELLPPNKRECLQAAPPACEKYVSPPIPKLSVDLEGPFEE